MRSPCFAACVIVVACAPNRAAPAPRASAGESATGTAAASTAPHAPEQDAGVRATHDVRVTKRPATAGSCWTERRCSDVKTCQAPEDPTFGGCPVPGCRERALHESCKSNLDCFAGYSCELGPNEWLGRGDTWHCERIHCAADADCLSANLRCGSGGICAAIPCTKSSECDGYCFFGTCSAKPGVCVDSGPPLKRP